ncbi:MAG: hypothetical protein JSV96_16730 [Candidatus Aminicenantes bacterium]|nr:MAG: hypothetical protein JSV96_16730 [Candidatus Aminicenantes bacterium]
MILSRTRKVFLLLSIIIISSISLSNSSPVNSKSFHQEIYFKNTPYELNVYRIKGRQPGKTMLIIGGIHGEPGGYLSADHYVDMKLEKGSLIVVPRANFYTIIKDTRGARGDMNRKFTSDKPSKDYYSQIVEILKNLMAESDILLNLHEGTGFYRDEYASERKNPNRFGQSIIADVDIYYQKDSSKSVNLKEIVEEVIESVNKKIENKEYYFHFNNHNTFSPDTKHPEQRGSATFYALSNFGIPAFGIESSSDIKDIEIKVRHQIWIINEFLRIFDIVPEIPGLYLEYPELEFIILAVNNANPIMIPNKETLYIRKNDEVEISHIEANYKRGLSADILGHGSENDFGTRLKIQEPTKIIIKKDKFTCGEIDIQFAKAIYYKEVIKEVSGFSHLVIDINGSIEVVDAGGFIDVAKGEIIRIIDSVPPIKDKPDYRLNFYGFVPKDKAKRKDDTNCYINTARDLITRFSRNGEGEIFEIRLSSQGNIITAFPIRLISPKLNYILIRSKNNSYRVKDGETISFTRGDQIIIEKAQTNIRNDRGIKVNFKGFVGAGDGEDRNKQIGLNRTLLKRYSINNLGRVYPVTVSINGRVFGRVFVSIG